MSLFSGLLLFIVALAAFVVCCELFALFYQRRYTFEKQQRVAVIYFVPGEHDSLEVIKDVVYFAGRSDAALEAARKHLNTTGWTDSGSKKQKYLYRTAVTDPRRALIVVLPPPLAS